MAKLKVEVIVGLIDRLTKPLSILGKRMSKAGAWMGAGGIAASIGGKQILEPIKNAVRASVELESAMADVRKVVDFPTAGGLGKLQAQIEQLTRSIPLAASELAGIAAAGGQLGIAAPDLSSYTETVAKMATAFEMVPQAAGEAMAKLANVYKVPIKDIGSLGDAINHLSNNAAASAPDVVEALRRMGNAASFGLAAKDAAGLATALMALGETPERTGSAINYMLTQLQTAGKQGKKFQAALAEIGMSSDTLDASLAKSAKGGLMDLLSALSQLDERARTGVMVDLFGKDHTPKLQKLVGNLQETQRVMDLVGDRSKFAGSMQTEFANRSDTTANRLTLLSNRIAVVTRSIGNALLPVIESLTNRFGPLVDKLGAWIERNKWLAGTIATVVAAIGGALVVLGPFAIALGMLVGGLGMVSGGAAQLAGVVGLLGGPIGKLNRGVALIPLGAAKAAKALRAMALAAMLNYKILGPAGLTKALLASTAAAAAAPFKMMGRGLLTAATAARALSVALLASPIGWVGLAIAGAAALIYKYWAPISGFFRGLWAGLTEGLKKLEPVFAPLAKVFKPVGDAIGWLVEKVGALLGPVEDVGGAAEALGRKFGGWIASAIGGIVEFVTHLDQLPAKLLKLGSDMVQSIKNGFGPAWSSFIGWVKTKFQELVAAASNLAALFKDVGRRIVEGLKAGIAAAWTGVKSWFSNKIKGLVSAAKGALKIKSPSGIFVQIGTNLIRGLHQGIARRADGVLGQVRRLAAGLAAVPLGLAPIASPALTAMDRTVAQMGPRNHPALTQHAQHMRQGPGSLQWARLTSDLAAATDESRGRMKAMTSDSIGTTLLTRETGHGKAPRGKGGAGAPGGGGLHISMPISITIQAPTGTDEQAIAALVKRQMEDAGGHIVRRLSSFYDDPDDV